MNASSGDVLPANLASLHAGEEQLREKALALIMADDSLRLHLAVTEAAMDLADRLRQFDTTDEDLKVAQILGMRTFNAFGASIKLALAGYSQNSALIMRDVLETVFLIDLFAGDRTLIQRWRFAEEKARIKDFGPVKVREALDTRDGFTGKKRYESYKMFSELAGHAFVESLTLEAVLSEMGRLAVQAGEKLDHFFPDGWRPGLPSRRAFAQHKQRWMDTFYPGLGASGPKPTA